MDIVNQAPVGDADAVTAQPQAEIPEKFQGKSAAEIAQMYSQLESKLGKQSEEIGQLRDLARQQMEANKQPEVDPLDDYPPEERAAIEKLIEDKLAPLHDTIADYRERRVIDNLNENYPGWQKTVQSEKFQNWVAASNVRVELFRRANEADLTAATELLSNFAGFNIGDEEKKEVSEKAVKRDRLLRAASTEKGTGTIDSSKVLYAEDLQALKISNPERYRQLEPDIIKAYVEERVKNKRRG